MATPTSNVSNVKLGVCKVTFDGNDMGLTQGGVEVQVKTDKHAINVDQFGKTAVSEVILGRTITIKVPMAETTIDNMVTIMPGATMLTDTATGHKRVDVPHGIGIDLRSIAKQLVLHPKEKADTDQSEDFIVPLAMTAGDLQFAYKLENERVYNVEFTGYPDNVTGKLFSYGDPAVVGA